MNPVMKIGSIQTGVIRESIYWDGMSLVDERGVEIPDGAADTLEAAHDLAAHLWELPEWDYQQEDDMLSEEEVAYIVGRSAASKAALEAY